MRSVVAAGMSLALEHLGFRNAFDDVYGSSAGTIIGAYFVTGQARLAPAIYFEDLCSRKFINMARVLRRRPVMSLDFLFDVFDRSKPLDWDGVARSPIRFHPLATSLTEGRAVDFGDLADGSEVRSALRAASILPVIGGPPIEFRGMRCLDAGLFESFPFRTAISDGCTHVLVLRTRPVGDLPARVSWKQRLLVEKLLREERMLVDLADERPARYESEVRELEALSAATDGDGPKVDSIDPPDGLTLDRLALDSGRVRESAIDGIHAVFRHFQLEEPRIFNVLLPDDWGRG